jgi:hypothetical protein
VAALQQAGSRCRRGWVFSWVIFLFSLFPLSFCTKEVGKQRHAEPAPQIAICGYEKEVRPIVIVKCAISGCHVSGFPFGDFQNYETLKQRVESGRVETLVFEQQLMPPAASQQLTGEEITTLKCWIKDGAPKN